MAKEGVLFFVFISFILFSFQFNWPQKDWGEPLFRGQSVALRGHNFTPKLICVILTVFIQRNWGRDGLPEADTN